MNEDLRRALHLAAANPSDRAALDAVARLFARLGIGQPPLVVGDGERRYFNDDGSLAMAAADLFDEEDMDTRGHEPRWDALAQADALRLTAPDSAAAYLWWASEMALQTHGNYTTRTLFFRACPGDKRAAIPPHP